jgi:predicted ester cyclase
MSTEQLKSAVKNFIENGLNKQDWAVLEGYFSPSLVDHALPPMLPPGLEGRKMFAAAFFAAFPDIHVHVEDLLAEGERTVLRWSAHGTHQGELMGIPATGKSVNMTGIAIDRFENGRSVEHWEEIDQMGLMQQLGVIPTE